MWGSPFLCEYFNMNESIKFGIRKIVRKGCCYRNLKFLLRFLYIKISLVLLCILIATGFFNFVKYFYVLLMQNAESSLQTDSLSVLLLSLILLQRKLTHIAKSEVSSSSWAARQFWMSRQTVRLYLHHSQVTGTVSDIPCNGNPSVRTWQQDCYSTATHMWNSF